MLLFQAGKAETSPWVLTVLPVSKPGLGKIRIEGEARGICRADLHVAEEGWTAQSPPAPPRRLYAPE